MSLKIVFMGTPDFAVPALRALHSNNYNVMRVVTQPDRPKGRGRKPTPPPVKQAAVELGYGILQPKTIKTDEFRELITALAPDVIIVVAFGQILPKYILDIPVYGCINIHASLLPRYRGAAPIQWALIQGEAETGVTTMFMDEGLDTGDIIMSARLAIQPDDTSAMLHDRLADLGADLLIQTLKGLETGSLHPVAQDGSLATYAPILKKQDGLIDWSKSAHALESFIRGVTPWPGAFTFFNEKRLKIFKARALSQTGEPPPGTILKGFPDELVVAAGKGVLSILELQSASGKRLAVRDFLRGHPFPPGTVLG